MFKIKTFDKIVFRPMFMVTNYKKFAGIFILFSVKCIYINKIFN